MIMVSEWLNNISWAETKNFAETLALLSAALFFAYKLFSGYQVVNLSVKLSCIREPSPTLNKDYLAILVTLLKGDRGSLRFYDAQVRVTSEGEKDEIILPLADIRRLSFQDQKLRWDRLSRSVPFIWITPGDEVLFSCYCEVEKGKPSLIEVAISGRKKFHPKTGQWRASLVSLPKYSHN
jgi:hypothetical protein